MRSTSSIEDGVGDDGDAAAFTDASLATLPSVMVDVVEVLAAEVTGV